MVVHTTLLEISCRGSFTFCIPLLNSYSTIGDFYCLLITFANILDTDQARQNVGPDLDLNCLTL